jgi:hypothetical protein
MRVAAPEAGTNFNSAISPSAAFLSKSLISYLYLLFGKSDDSVAYRRSFG